MDIERELVFCYLQEDDAQRSLYSVRPLLAAEGDIREQAKHLFPEQGCLRVVPDRKECHDFRNRMRMLGHFCVISIMNFSSGSSKIRPNKTSEPASSHPRNHYMIYSDAIQNTPEYGFYCVLDGPPADCAKLASRSFTRKFYIRQDDQLYGPFLRRAPIIRNVPAYPDGKVCTMDLTDSQKISVLVIPEELPSPKSRRSVQAPVSEKPQSDSSEQTDVQKAVLLQTNAMQAELLETQRALDRAKTSMRTFQRETIELASHNAQNRLLKLEEEKSLLLQEIQELKKQHHQLQFSVTRLLQNIKDQTASSLPEKTVHLLSATVPAYTDDGLTQFYPCVTGVKTPLPDMLNRIRSVFDFCSVPYDEDWSIVFLLLLAMQPRFSVCASRLPYTLTFFQNLSAAMGWKESTCLQFSPDSHIHFVQHAPDPVPALILSTDSLFSERSDAHRIILSQTLSSVVTSAAFAIDPFPILCSPVQNQAVPLMDPTLPTDQEPVSLSSLTDLLSVTEPIDIETADQILSPIQPHFAPLSGKGILEMIQFAAAASHHLPGGIRDACDWAVLLWLLPGTESQESKHYHRLIQEFPRSSKAFADLYGTV